MATHSSTGKSHGQRSLAVCSPWGYKRVGRDSVAKQIICYIDFFLLHLQELGESPKDPLVVLVKTEEEMTTFLT